MQKKMIEQPSYLIASVDNALHVLQLLRDVGPLRLSDVAAELGVAPSTAHRLLAMLVYRGFAVQDEKRVYHPGSAMGAGPAQRGWTRQFTDRCRPHMEALCTLTGETVNLVVRVGTQVRFLHTVESAQLLRVGDRQGQVLDAELTAGGRALLAELPRSTLERLYLLPPEISVDDRDWGDRRLPATEFERFVTDLTGSRKLGFALNVGQTEEGVAAFGVAVHDAAGAAIGAWSVAVPAVRYRRHAQGPLVAQLKRAVRECEVDLADIKNSV
jgi:DNA-binding IclR family transcriptional regulator